MAGTLVPTPLNGDPDWTNWIQQLEAVKNGWEIIDISNMTNNNEPKLQAGSWVEVGGSIYKYTAEETISNWVTIPNGVKAWIRIVPSGSTCTTSWTQSPPTYSAPLKGWYNGANRYIGGCFKVGATTWQQKWKYQDQIDDVDGGMRFNAPIYDKNGREVLALKFESQHFDWVWSPPSALTWTSQTITFTFADEVQAALPPTVRCEITQSATYTARIYIDDVTISGNTVKYDYRTYATQVQPTYISFDVCAVLGQP